MLTPLLLGCADQHWPTERLPAAPHTAQSEVRPFPVDFGYGSNLGYYTADWTDERLARAAQAAGANTLRVTLPEAFLDKWGENIRRHAFAYYADSLHLRNLVCFVGEPAYAHRDRETYPGCRKPSQLFANLYEPIWNADSTVNPNNYYAQYIYRLIRLYGANIRVWEVVNEPDFVRGRENKKWLTRPPEAIELPNLRAPIFHYIRTLRITWEVVKKYQPTAYVSPGGLGYPEFLDALLRYTDNPDAGIPTAAYPASGGAYFDVLTYHVYPSYYLRRRNWDRLGMFDYARHSDAAAARIITRRDELATVLRRYGYDGSVYPRKPFIVTETNVSRRTTSWRTGTDELQRNFGIKALVLAQKHGLRQVHFYNLGETAAPPRRDDRVWGEEEYELMGLYESLARDSPGHEKLTPLGQALRATACQLRGLRYSPERTLALRLPPEAEGAAFTGRGRTVFVLWAKTHNDQSEAAAAFYAFPAALSNPCLTRYAWDYAPGRSPAVEVSADAVTLTGTPAFFVAGTTVGARLPE